MMLICGGQYHHTDEENSGQVKKTLNVDSPSFTPSLLSPNTPAAGAVTVPKKLPSISPKAASAAPFMPKAIIPRPSPDAVRIQELTSRPGSSNATPFRQDSRTPDWHVSEVQEFVPRSLVSIRFGVSLTANRTERAVTRRHIHTSPSIQLLNPILTLIRR